MTTRAQHWSEMTIVLLGFIAKIIQRRLALQREADRHRNFRFGSWLYPRYEVYRGYIVFAFSVILFVCLSVCLSVNFFSVKDFSATTWVRILKFGAKLDSDELYCVTKEQPHIAYQSHYLFIFLSLQWNFLSQISQLLLEPLFSNFVYIFRKAKFTV